MKKVLFTLVMLFALVSTAFAGEKELRFTWEQVIDVGFGGWNVYMSTSPNVQTISGNLFSSIPYTGTDTYVETKMIESPDGQKVTYYFVITSFNVIDQESDKSNEVFIEIDFTAVPPGTPILLTIIVTSVP